MTNRPMDTHRQIGCGKTLSLGFQQYMAVHIQVHSLTAAFSNRNSLVFGDEASGSQSSLPQPSLLHPSHQSQRPHPAKPKDLSTSGFPLSVFAWLIDGPHLSAASASSTRTAAARVRGCALAFWPGFDAGSRGSEIAVLVSGGCSS